MNKLKKMTEAVDILNELSIDENADAREKWQSRAGLLFRAVTSIENTTSGWFEFLIVYPHLDDCDTAIDIAKKYWEQKLKQC